jgi:pilus assembly protein Flp/PilA
MMTKFRNLLKNKSGATAIEYGLIAALIGVVIISALTTMGQNMATQFQTIADDIGAAAPQE